MLSPERNFAHLDVKTSFTPGALGSAKDYVRAAKSLGMEVVGIADTENIASWSNLAKEAEAQGIAPIFGVELRPEVSAVDQRKLKVVLLVCSPEGFHSLYRLLNLKKRRGLERNKEWLEVADLKDYREGLVAIAPRDSYEALVWTFHPATSLFLKGLNFGDNTSHEALAKDLAQARDWEARVVASNQVWCPFQQDFNQVLSLILQAKALRLRLPRNLLSLDKLSDNQLVYQTLKRALSRGELDPRLSLFHPEGWLKPAKMMKFLFKDAGEVYWNAWEIATACRNQSLPEPALPAYPVPEGLNAFEYLRQLCQQRAIKRYGKISQVTQERLGYELRVIGERGLAGYFLICHDVVEFCQSKGIKFAGIGSVTGSLVAYLLGITQADPITHDLLFERFLGPATEKIPDIDGLVPSTKRREIFSYLFSQFPDLRGIYPARIAVFPSYGIRGALRTVLSVFGFDSQTIKAVQRTVYQQGRVPPAADPYIMVATSLVRRKSHKDSVASHGSKIIFTPHPPQETFSVIFDREEYPVVEIDRHAAEAWANIDLVSSHPLDLISQVKNRLAFNQEIPRNDPETLKMIFQGDTIGIPFLETEWLIKVLRYFGWAASPGSLTEKDLVVAFALSRPGAAGSLDTYLDHLRGKQTWTPSHPDLQQILGQTLGVVAFQEQVVLLAREVAGFSPVEAENLREAITKDRKPEKMLALSSRFVNGALAHGLSETEAKLLFRQMSQFVRYGFLKGHALALMGQIAYIAAYLKRCFPQIYFEEFMKIKHGFYFRDQPWVYEREARRLGVYSVTS